MTSSTLLHLLTHGTFAILTANQPAFTPAVSGGNDALRADLESMGLQPVSIAGMYRGESDGESFLVPGLDAETALVLGRKYGQNEVIVPGWMVETRTADAAPWTGAVTVGSEALHRDYYSIVPGPGGGTAFSLDFNFDTPRTRLPELLAGGAAHLYQAAA